MKATPFHLAVCLLLIFLAHSGLAQFVAFNDANPGTGTHSNATTYGGYNNTLPLPLKDIATGTNLAVGLQIGQSGSGVISSSACCSVAPPANSPAAKTFAPYTTFPGGSLVGFNGSITYTQHFSGLDPAREYSLRATVSARNPTQGGWLRVELHGALAATTAHSAGCLVKSNAPSLRVRQVLFHALDTNALSAGDVIGWDHIRPSADGKFSITSIPDFGSLPSNSSLEPYVPALSKIRLEEQLPSPLAQITEQPSSAHVHEDEFVELATGVAGAGLSLQWFKDSIALPGATNALLTIPVAITNHAGVYYLLASNATSTARSSNAVLLVNPAPTKNFVRLGQLWRYNASGTDLGTAWKEPGFDDAAWPAGPGVLGIEEERTLAPLIRTPLPPRDSPATKINTYYFRTHFNWTQSATGAYLVATNLVDDGAVIYLNGAELFRFHMPEGTIRYTNEATFPAIGNATFVSTNLPASLLVPGDNLLAAEVHQAGSNSSDVLFGLTLTLETQPSLAITRASGALELNWSDPQFDLQSSTNPAGPWSTLSTNRNTLRVSPTNSAQFFRLKR